LKLWDLATGKEAVTLRGHPSAVSALAFRPDGTRLVSASQDGSLKVWDPATGRELVTLHDTDGAITCLAFTPDGHRLVSGDARGVLTIRDGSPAADKSRAGTQPPPAPEDDWPPDP
jgi:WD40 repeat protein